MTEKSCGACTLCCKLMSVVEIAKPAAAWCVHADQASGCRIYADRPGSCHHFNCLWLTEPGLGPELRPDRVRTVLIGYHAEGGQKVIVAVCDKASASAWRAKPTIDLLRVAAHHGHPVFATTGRRTWQVLADGEIEADHPPAPAQGSGLLSFDSASDGGLSG